MPEFPSREQEREGYSIPAQRKLLAAYARSHDLRVEHEFIDIESAKNLAVKNSAKMLRLLETDDAAGSCSLKKLTASIEIEGCARVRGSD